MNQEVSNVVTSLANRGLTGEAAGVILGAYLQQTPNVTTQYKQQVLTAIAVIKLREEKKQEAELAALIQLLSLTQEETEQSVQAAIRLVETGTNG